MQEAVPAAAAAAAAAGAGNFTVSAGDIQAMMAAAQKTKPDPRYFNPKEPAFTARDFGISKHAKFPMEWNRMVSQVPLAFKPSLRYDYPLNAPNTVSRPIRDAGELFNVH